MSHPTDSFVRGAGRTDRGMPSGASRDCGFAGTCLQSVVLSERIRALYGELATIRTRLDRLDTVLSHASSVAGEPYRDGVDARQTVSVEVRKEVKRYAHLDDSTSG